MPIVRRRHIALPLVLLLLVSGSVMSQPGGKDVRFYNGNGSSKLGDTGYFWSSTPEDVYNGAYYVNFSDGDVNGSYGKSDSYSVRCVRW